MGVVVIPGSHGKVLWGEDQCAIVSLYVMDPNNPNSGGTSATMLFSNNNGSRSSYEGVIDIDYASDKVQGIVTGSYYGYIPNDQDLGSYYPCLHDTNSAWSNESNSRGTARTPSPYLTDGSINPMYRQTSSPSSKLNCLSDFEGKEDCDYMVSNYTFSQKTWKTDAKIIAVVEDEDGNYCGQLYPPIQCCWRYCPTGTNQGDWYLPSIAELGYLLARKKTINESFATIKSIYNIGMDNIEGSYWASTQRYYKSGWHSIWIANTDSHIGNLYADTPYHGAIAYLRV